MRLKLNKVVNKGVVIGLIVIIILQTIFMNITHVVATNYDMVGTNKALGSPVLDPNFTAEEWNKWEMLTWGIFLSNFAVPLIDDYDSAFNVNSTYGSKGKGFKALAFGSGSDNANAETIKGMVNYAVNQQKSGGLKDIHVDFSNVTRKEIKKPDGAKTREATFKDLFIMDDKKDGDTWLKFENVNGVVNTSAKIVPIEGDTINEGAINAVGKGDKYLNMVTLNEGSLPTFYVKHGSGFEKVFDYTDGWDAQILTAWIARAAAGDSGKEFKTVMNDMWSKAGTLKLYLDQFGNIVTQYNGSRRIIIPAAGNQHLTASPKINLLNSMIFNGLSSDLSSKELGVRGQQSVSGWFGSKLSSNARLGGLPAFGSYLSNVPRGLINVYYDLDTIMYNNYFFGGEAANGNKTVAGEDGTVNKIHYGRALKQLFDLDASKKNGNKYMFKIEAANMDDFDFGGFKDKSGDALKNMLRAGGQIANIKGANVKADILSYVKTTNGDVSLFSNPVVFPVQMAVGRDEKSNKMNSAGVGRLFINFLYEAYSKVKTTTAGEVKSEFITALLNDTESAEMKNFKETILGTKDGTVNSLLANFVAEKSELFKIQVDPTKLQGAKLGDKKNPFYGMKDVSINNKKAAEVAFTDKGGLDYFPGRVVKAYPSSDVMKAVGNVLGVKQGTEFDKYSVFIYMTYLDWYGIRLDKLNKVASSEFNTKIFDGSEDVLKVDINSIASIKSEEDKKKEVLNYTYMMLHPTEGKEYRSEMIDDVLTSFIYNNYQKMVYGNSTYITNSVNPDLSTRNATGFLNLPSYSDNFTTAWFMKLYTKVAIVLIGLSFILIVVIGLLKGKKFSWFLIALTVVVNTILIVPAAGEVTPMVANHFVQNIFKGKMTYWGVSEAVANAKIEADAIKGTAISNGFLSSLNQTEKDQVVKLVKTLNTVYLDRALMVKMDISRKVTQTQRGNFAEIQTLRSARWMLPMIMRQFTATDESANYVHVPLGDMYDDLSNMYWLYNPDDAIFSGTLNGQQNTIEPTDKDKQNNKDDKAKTGDKDKNGNADNPANAESAPANKEEPIKVSDRKAIYPDYIDTSIQTGVDESGYRSEAYYRGKTLDDMPHTYFYLLKGNACPLNRQYGFDGEYKDKKSFDKYMEKTMESGKTQAFATMSTQLEQQAGTYDRFDRSTVLQSFGYLWSTESPYHYFYQSIKDSFDSDITLGALVGKLQGQYEKQEDGSEARTSFMHAGTTGHIRDIVDLQELITNMVPYLYEMQLTTGGDDGESGVLGSEKITDYEIYKNNNKSWLFRSNWVTKLMESPELTKPVIARDANGNRIEIKNPMLIDCYPSDRPMIFSEAQLKQSGLHEADLTLAELKCIKVNKDISRRWTLLLNYANVPGITKEVMMRQMATEAIMAFNAEFSPSGITSGAYKMYPDGLDLRAISFDSVMKMLMLNLTKDTTYIYGDTMKNIIQDTDILSAMLLLIAAFICTYIIPLVRNIALGLIFFLGFTSIVYALISSNKQKMRVSCGFIISNLIFLVMTLIYYGLFSSLMAITNTDSVLTVQNIEVNTGNPVWCFIVLIVIGLLYMAGMVFMIVFCFRHYRDMGMEVYATIAGQVTDKVSNGLSKLGDKISGFSSTGYRGISGGSSSRGKSKSSKNNDDSDRGSKKSKKIDDEVYDSKVYASEDKYDDSENSKFFDEQIKKGKNKLK